MVTLNELRDARRKPRTTWFSPATRPDLPAIRQPHRAGTTAWFEWTPTAAQPWRAPAVGIPPAAVGERPPNSLVTAPPIRPAGDALWRPWLEAPARAARGLPTLSAHLIPAELAPMYRSSTQAVRQSSSFVVWLAGCFGRNLQDAARRWQDDDADALAASVTYYATVSLFPLLLVLIAGLGFFLRFSPWGQDAKLSVLNAISRAATPEVGRQVGEMFEQVQSQALFQGPIGFGGLVLATLAVFSQIDRAFDRISDVERARYQGMFTAAANIARHRFRAFVTLVGLGALVVAIFLAGLATAAARVFVAGHLPWLDGLWRIMDAAVSIGVNAAIFGLVFRQLSKTHVGWVEALRGGLLSAVVWELGRFVLATFLIGSRYSAYGVVGSLLAVMLWTYYACNVLFFGAEYTQVLRDQRLRATADPIPHPHQS